MKKIFLFGFFAAALSLAGCSSSDNPSSAGKGYNIVSNGMYKNHTWGEWSGLWWSWALAMPNGANAVQGTAPMETNQSGEVWFLSGNLKGGTETRTVTVPLGKSLFVSILNFYADTTGGYPPADSLTTLAQQIWDGGAATIGLIEIDGQALTSPASNYYAPVTTFMNPSIPKDNVIGDETYGKANISSFAASCGYYMMIDGLSSGSHTIHFKASNLLPLSIDMTYNVTVK